MRACGMQVHLHCGCALVATGAKHPQIQPAGHGHSAARSPHMPIQHAANGHRPAPQQGAAHECRSSRRLQRLSGPESGHPPRPTAADSRIRIRGHGAPLPRCNCSWLVRQNRQRTPLLHFKCPALPGACRPGWVLEIAIAPCRFEFRACGPAPPAPRCLWPGGCLLRILALAAAAAQRLRPSRWPGDVDVPGRPAAPLSLHWPGPGAISEFAGGLFLALLGPTADGLARYQVRPYRASGRGSVAQNSTSRVIIRFIQVRCGPIPDRTEPYSHAPPSSTVKLHHMFLHHTHCTAPARTPRAPCTMPCTTLALHTTP